MNFNTSRVTNIRNQIIMNLQNISPLKALTIIVFVILTALIIRLVTILIKGIVQTRHEMKSDLKKRIDDSIKDKNAYTLFLSQNGIMYRFHDYNMDPSTYYIAKATIAGIAGCFLYLITFSVPVSLLAAVGLFLLMDKIFISLSKNDYKDMQMDLYETYIVLKNQLQANCYINSSLTYIRDNIINLRYKEALSELITNLSSKETTTDTAIEVFKSRFNCTQIDGLCSMLSSYFTYGLNPQLLEGLTSQISATLKADCTKEESRVDNITSIVSVSLLGVAIILILFAMAQNMQSMTIFNS